MSGESEAAVKKNEPNLPLKSLGKYLIERKLGQGGMGTVYLAKHTDLKKMIALKVLPQDKAKNPTLVKRFKAEAQAAAQLEHPNIVAVYDTGEADGYLYIAMEYVEGIDLFEQVKRRGVIPVKRSIDIIKQVASALQHAFEQNIVHRDIKPSNLLLRHDGVVKVTDLGLARSIDDTLETNITRAGTTVGTVDYMAPEQARNSKLADIRSDIYSLGCTWYQMLTGEPPFPEGSLTNKLQAHAIKPLPDPREKNENIPEGLFAVLQRMTAKKPDDRYQTPAELLDDLAHSKLTKAAFSNEIFSDLSDYELTATESHSEEDGNGDDPAPPDEAPVSRRSRMRDADNDDADAISFEPSRRKAKSRDRDENELEEPEEPARRKSRSRDVEPIPIDDTQPLKSRKKRPASTSHDEDAGDDQESRPAGNSSKRTASEPDGVDRDDVEPDEPSSSKRKRNSLTEDDGKTSPYKSGKSSSASETGDKKTKSSSVGETSDKKATKNGPKPLPPKRQALPPQADEQKQLNLESLKFLGVVAGLLVLIGGIGTLVYRWSNQIETVNHAVAANDANAAIATVTPPAQNPTDATDKSSVTVSVVDPPKTGANERPAIEYDIAKQPLPNWVTSDTAEPRDLPILTVGPGAVTATHFASLDQALQAADKGGAVLHLMGPGPFSLSSVDLGNARKLVISSATNEDQPLVIFKPSESNAATGLAVNGGILDLRGLHFILERRPNTAASTRAMISVNDGQLFVRHCSFTATGGDDDAATALSFTSTQDSQMILPLESQLLLDRVVVRGNGLTGLQIDRSTADVVIQDSLFATGTAPAISLDGHLASNLADVALAKPRRTIRVLRTTLCARKQALELAAENTSKPPSTAILFQDSVCTAEGSGNSAVLANAAHWPSVTSTSGGWLTNLTWTSVSSLYLGFDRLLDLDKASFKVAGIDVWQRVWGKRFESMQFQPILWQESTVADLSAIQPYDFDTAKLPYHEVKSTKGQLPGCPIGRLNVPGVISQARLQAINQRPRLPNAVSKPNAPTQTKKVDLMKEDLGLVINRNEWQSGTLFEATGSGTRFSSPAKIVGKSLRIVFRQGEGAPLKLQPKVHDQKSKSDQPGLFNIENGLIDLQSATLEATQTAKAAAPPWLVNAKNSGVILRGCQFSGPLLQDLEQHQGLILWTTTSSYQPAEDAEPPFLSVNDSVLMSTGTGVRLECAQGRVFLRNSIVAIRGNGISLFPLRSNANAAPALELQHVTLSTTKAAIRVEAAAGTDEFPSPVRLFVDYCAICPPLDFKSSEASESTVMECVGKVREQKQIEWWGNSNGVAKEVKSFLRQSTGDSINSAADWSAVWGESNEFRLLSGAKGVNLTNTLPNKWVNLKPASFVLNPNSPGATWADGGRPVGVDFRAVEEAFLAKKSPMESKPGTVNASKPPSNAPNSAPTITGKKNAGF